MNTYTFNPLYFKNYVRYYDDPAPEGGDPADATLTVTVKKDEKTGKPIYLDPSGKQLFTQDHMNREIGSARQKAAEQNKNAIAQLTELQSRAGNSEELNAELQAKIDELKTLNLTEQQQHEIALKKIQEDHKKATESANEWRTRFETQTIDNEITNAALTHKAKRVEQIAAMLSGKTKLAPVLGEDGKPTGEYVAQVTMKEKDKEGKPVTLTLTVDKAVARMREQTELYGNLFLSGQKDGLDSGTLGMKPQYDGKKPPTTQEEYEEYRKANATRLGLKNETY